jgi:hypothetical protein
MPSKKTPRPKPALRKAQRKTGAAKAPGKAPRSKSSRDKVRAHRRRMRAKGLRLLQMWLPDTSTPEFRAQAHEDSLAIANSPTEDEDQAFVDSVQWLTSEEEEALRRLEPERWWRERDE